MPWHAKSTGSYDRTSQEALDNAYMLATALVSEGWSIPAIAALLGNGAGESGLNPWRWESDYVPTYNEFLGWSGQIARQHGYGIFGFTPASNYINSTNEQTYARYGYAPNFSDRAGNASDGEAQTRYFITTVAANWTHTNYGYYAPYFSAIGVDISTFYYYTYQQFTSGKDANNNDIPIADLTGAFELCYEKPANTAAASSYNARVNNANYWYQVLILNPPTPGGKADSFNIMFYIKPKWKKYF